MIELREQRPQHIDVTLDAKGLYCPLPILKTKVELNNMQPGEILHVLTTDPLAALDFKAYSARAAHTLIFLAEEDSYAEFFIEKGQS